MGYTLISQPVARFHCIHGQVLLIDQRKYFEQNTLDAIGSLIKWHSKQAAQPVAGVHRLHLHFLYHPVHPFEGGKITAVQRQKHQESLLLQAAKIIVEFGVQGHFLVFLKPASHEKPGAGVQHDRGDNLSRFYHLLQIIGQGSPTNHLPAHGGFIRASTTGISTLL